jgi:hypothetical protein
MRAMRAILRIEEVSSGARDESRNPSFYAKGRRGMDSYGIEKIILEPNGIDSHFHP